MELRNYIIDYQCFSKSGALLVKGKMRAKNKMSALEAQVHFERFLKNKYADFGRLIVLSCKEDLVGKFSNFIDIIFSK